jgi:antitoxin YefM
MDLNIREHIRPVSDFRRDTAQMLKRLKDSHQPIVLTQRGRSVAVILDVETYERLEYEGRLRASYAEGVRDLDSGKTFPHTEVMKQMNQSLKKHRAK